MSPHQPTTKLSELVTSLDAIADSVQGALKIAGNIETLDDAAWRAQVQAAKIVVEASDLGAKRICPQLDSARNALPSHMRSPTGTILNEGYQRLWFHISLMNQPRLRQPPLMPEDNTSEEARLRHAAVNVMDVCREIARKLRANQESEPSSIIPPKFVPTPRQTEILEALNGKMLTRDQLMQELGCESRSLYSSNRKAKTGGLTELMNLGFVENKKGGGYYRPDAPPQGSH